MPTSRRPGVRRADAKRVVPKEVADELERAAGPARAGRVSERLTAAAGAYERERYGDARRILLPLVQQHPVAAVRELFGLTSYRMGRWRDAIRELEAVEAMTASLDQHPVLADCHRALGHRDVVEALWDELRRGGVGVGILTEGRIVTASARADRGRVREAIQLLEQGPIDVRSPAEHTLRLWYALGAMYERAGDVARARELFRRLVRSAPDFADAADRSAALG